MRNFFLGPQAQFRNLKEALLRSQFRNFLKEWWSATAIPQSCNCNINRWARLFPAIINYLTQSGRQAGKQTGMQAGRQVADK
jgi:hypothetical protein